MLVLLYSTLNFKQLKIWFKSRYV